MPDQRQPSLTDRHVQRKHGVWAWSAERELWFVGWTALFCWPLRRPGGKSSDQGFGGNSACSVIPVGAESTPDSQASAVLWDYPGRTRAKDTRQMLTDGSVQVWI